ncbi:MAG: arsenate reductase ArsC [Thermoplasmata archaeon]|nr:MAG: arsenate reductase ArsC [Thermoplasmata archaeon]
MAKKILFVCVGNSCRSQIAEGFTKYIGGKDVDVKSAGTKPAEAVSGKGERVMAEKSIDISGQYPKELSAEDLEWADRVIVMGCGVEDHKLEEVDEKTEDWGIDDPIGQPVETYRKIRDEIEAKVRNLLDRTAEK